METNYDLTYKEREQVMRWRPTEKDIHMLDIDSAIEELEKLKQSGATYIRLVRNEHNEEEFYVMGCKLELETDEEYNERVQAYEGIKLRKEQAELVELARLKEKYEKKQ